MHVLFPSFNKKMLIKCACVSTSGDVFGDSVKDMIIKYINIPFVLFSLW